MSGAVVVSGLLQGTIGLLGVPGRVFPYCGPLVLAPSLVPRLIIQTTRFVKIKIIIQKDLFLVLGRGTSQADL